MNLTSWSSDTYKPGQKFGKLTIISTHKIVGTYRYYALCKCSCGSGAKHIRIDGIKKGNVVSCGCVQRERTVKHGCSGHPIFGVWCGMFKRCYSKKDKRFNRYGGRGITVCEEWKDPNAFIKDMYPTYKKGLQLDRINNNGNYSKNNCRWATLSEQASNKCNTVHITYKGETNTQREWANKLGLDEKLISYRIRNLGWDHVRALTEPVNSVKESCLRARKSRGRG